MKLAEIEQFVMDSLADYLRSVEKGVPPMSRNTKPIGDLGLESQDGVDWLCDLEDHGFVVPNNVCPFKTDSGKTLTISAIAELLQDHQVEE